MELKRRTDYFYRLHHSIFNRTNSGIETRLASRLLVVKYFLLIEPIVELKQTKSNSETEVNTLLIEPIVELKRRCLVNSRFLVCFLIEPIVELKPNRVFLEVWMQTCF